YYAIQAVFAGVQHGERQLPRSESLQRRLAELSQEAAKLEQQLAPFANPPLTSGSPVAAADDGHARRAAVNARVNFETLAPTDARFVRITIEATNQGQPCIDELEIFAGDENVALASAGAIASSSGDFVHPLHKLVHINDGR